MSVQRGDTVYILWYTESDPYVIDVWANYNEAAIQIIHAGVWYDAWRAFFESLPRKVKHYVYDWRRPWGWYCTLDPRYMEIERVVVK